MRRASRPNHLDSLLGVLDRKLEVVQASTFHASKEVELVSDIRQWLRVPAHLLIRDREAGHLAGFLLEELRNEGEKVAVGNEPDDNTERN